MSGEPVRLEVEHYCACGARMTGWFADEATMHREVSYWGRNHRGEGHGPVSVNANRKARRERGMKP